MLSGLFCCLGFSGVFFFAVWAGAWDRPNSNKKKHAPRPFRACFLCCLGGGVFIFLLFGRGGGRICFCCLGGGVVFFLLFGRGSCFVVLFGRGTGVHSLTGLPGSSSRGPTTTKTKQQKKKKARVPYNPLFYPAFKELWV